jgi:predicted dehydrogenase
MQDRLRGALVGFGFIAERGHSPEYAQQVARGELEIVAIADINGERRAAAARAFPRARLFDSHEALLETVGSDLDFVDVTTPPYAHAVVARAALERGLHVLCEKPITVSVAEANALAEQAKRMGRVLFPCHNYRHAPVVREVRRLLSSGAIGQVKLVTLQTFRTTHARGVAAWRPDWRRERQYSGGGIAMDHGSHTFYLAFEWLKSYPTSVTAKSGTSGSHDTEDNFSCTLTFPTGIATAHLTWTAGVRKVLYTLHGSRGAITVDDDDVTLHQPDEQGAAQRVDTREISSAWMDASHKDWFGGLFGEFREAIGAGVFVGAQTTDAIRCVETIAAAYESASHGSFEVPIGDRALSAPRNRSSRRVLEPGTTFRS